MVSLRINTYINLAQDHTDIVIAAERLDSYVMKNTDTLIQARSAMRDVKNLLEYVSETKSVRDIQGKAQKQRGEQDILLMTTNIEDFGSNPFEEEEAQAAHLVIPGAPATQDPGKASRSITTRMNLSLYIFDYLLTSK